MSLIGEANCVQFVCTTSSTVIIGPGPVSKVYSRVNLNRLTGRKQLQSLPILLSKVSDARKSEIEANRSPGTRTLLPNDNDKSMQQDVSIEAKLLKDPFP